MNDHDVEARLRDSLHRNAQGAPSGDPVAERVLHRVTHQQARPRRRRWRGWVLPLAVATAVVIAGTVTTTQPAVPASLVHVQLLVVSFTTTSEGWLLASADCPTSTSGADRCAALLRTTDGGGHWVAANPPPAPVQGAGCAMRSTSTDASASLIV